MVIHIALKLKISVKFICFDSCLKYLILKNTLLRLSELVIELFLGFTKEFNKNQL